MMTIFYNAGAALLMGVVLFGVLGLQVLDILARSRQRVPVEDRRAVQNLSRLSPSSRKAPRR